jgi:hypothetical protein
VLMGSSRRAGTETQRWAPVETEVMKNSEL